MPDVSVVPLLESGLAALQEAFASNPNPPARIGLRVGEEIVHDLDGSNDLCCAGLAYLSVGDQTPVWTGVDVDLLRQEQQQCAPPLWVIRIRMGILRCTPYSDDTSMPDESEWTAAAIQDAHDCAALRDATARFQRLAAGLDGRYRLRVLVDSVSMVPPDGGCLERWVQLYAQIHASEC